MSQEHTEELQSTTKRKEMKLRRNILLTFRQIVVNPVGSFASERIAPHGPRPSPALPPTLPPAPPDLAHRDVVAFAVAASVPVVPTLRVAPERSAPHRRVQRVFPVALLATPHLLPATALGAVPVRVQDVRVDAKLAGSLFDDAVGGGVLEGPAHLRGDVTGTGVGVVEGRLDVADDLVTVGTAVLPQLVDRLDDLR
jgi:hypothetical protein